MVIPLSESSVTVSCPVATMVTTVEWFNDDDMMLATGIDYNVNATGSYYCQVTEERGVYRSNTFTVYRTGKLLYIDSIITNVYYCLRFC